MEQQQQQKYIYLQKISCILYWPANSNVIRGRSVFNLHYYITYKQNCHMFYNFNFIFSPFFVQTIKLFGFKTKTHLLASKRGKTVFPTPQPT